MLFFCLFQCFEEKEYQTESKQMKSLGAIFSEQMQSRRLGVDVKKQPRRPRGSRARPRGVGAPPPLWAPHSSIDVLRLYILLYTENIQSTTKNYFHRRNLMYPRDPILEPLPVLRRRGNRPRRASTSSPRPFR